MQRNSSYYGYDYFSGANIYVKINGTNALEVAGISYQVQDSSAPIYGYSSRVFDAVAMGQKIIKGSIVINFIHPNYLAQIIERGVAAQAMNDAVLGNLTQQELQTTTDMNTELDILRKYISIEDEFNKRAREKGSHIEDLYRYDLDIDPGVQNALDQFKKAKADWEFWYPKYQIAPDAVISKGYGYESVEDLLLKAQAILTEGSDVRVFLESKGYEYAHYFDDTRIIHGKKDSEVEQFEGGTHTGYELNTDSPQFQKNLEIYLKLLESGQFGDMDTQRTYNSRRTAAFTDAGLEYASREQIEQYRQILKEKEAEYTRIVSAQATEREGYNRAYAELEQTLNRLSSDSPESRQSAFAELDAIDTAYNKYYATPLVQGGAGSGEYYNTDIGLLGPFIIDINYAKEYTIKIIDAFFTSRGSMIQIDESSVVEEYSFFAREIKYITKN